MTIHFDSTIHPFILPLIEFLPFFGIGFWTARHKEVWKKSCIALRVKKKQQKEKYLFFGSSHLSAPIRQMRDVTLDIKSPHRLHI